MPNENKPALQASFISVTSVKRTQGKAEITLSNGEAIAMPRAMLKERPYKAGFPFDKEAHDVFIRTRSYAFALDKAVSLLAVRSRTEREIADALRKNAYGEPVVARVMARLHEAGYINDAEFAEHWASSRASKGMGTMRIRMELRHKGVEQSAIDDAVSSMDQDTLFDGAVKAAQKAARGRDLSQAAERQKVLAALARRGFDYATSRRALQQVMTEQN